MINEKILNILSTYGADVILIALLINITTGIIKITLKKCLKAKGVSIGKYITLIPILLGFGFAFLSEWLICGADNVVMETVFSKGITCASLSLSLYAIYEKFFPKSNGDIHSESESGGEDAENAGKEKSSTEKISETQNGDANTKVNISNNAQSFDFETKIKNSRIILRGKRDEQTEIKN